MNSVFSSNQSPLSNLLISVIIPSLNHAEFILDAIASIENCLEWIDQVIIVVVNRGQDPATRDILTYLECQGYQILETSSSQNFLDIFNAATQQAENQLILWMPVQHKIKPDYIITCLEILDQYPDVGIVYSNAELFGQATGILELPDFELATLDHYDFFNVCTVLRQTMLQETHGIQREIYSFNQGNWWQKIFEAGWRFYHLNQVLFDYRVISDFSLSRNAAPLVSICIPTYQGESFIGEAISSALFQTYSPLEIIISDDGSTDKTLEICQYFQKHSSIPIKILTHEKYGMVKNWNFCLNHTQGKYIKFLFQDDILEPTCLETMVALAETDQKIGLVFSRRNIIFDKTAEGNSDLIAVYQQLGNLEQAWSNLKQIQPGQQLLADPRILKFPINKIGEPSTVLIHSDVFAKVGYFDPELNQLADLDLWLRIMSHYHIGFVDQPLSYFRIHPQQQTYQNIQLDAASDPQFYDKVSHHPCYQFFPAAIRQEALLIYTLLINEQYIHQDHNAFLRLCGIRKEVAALWLSSPFEQLETLYRGLLGIIHRILMRNSMKNKALILSDFQFFQDLLELLKNQLSSEKMIPSILAFMLYGNVNQLPMRLDSLIMPPWLLKDFKKWYNSKT